MEHQHLLFPGMWEGWEHPWVLLCQLASLGSFAGGEPSCLQAFGLGSPLSHGSTPASSPSG